MLHNDAGFQTGRENYACRAAYLRLITFKCSVEKQLHGQQLTSMNAEHRLISGSASQITSTNTAGIRTKEMNLSLKISVFVPPRNIPRACYKCKITHMNLS